MAGLTREELRKEIADTVKETTLPMIKEIVGPAVAEAVKAAVDKAPYASGKNPIEALLAAAGNVPQKAASAKADMVGRFIRCIGAAKMTNRQPIDIAKAWNDESMVAMLEDGAARAKAVPMAAGDALAGGFLVPEQFSAEVIEFLRPASIVRRLGPLTMPMTTGTLNIPKVTAGSSGSYQGENTNIVASNLGTGNIKLTYKKLSALVPVSNDLLRYSSPGADAVVRTDLVRAMASRENQAFIRDDGTASTPKGIRYWAATVLNATVTVNLANTVTDLGRLIVALMNYNIPLTKPAWMMAPRIWNYLMTLQNSNGFYVFREEMMAGRLWGYPFGVSTHVPINLTDRGGTAESELYFVDMDDVVLGESLNLLIDASQEAAYVQGTTMVSAYSQDQTVIRAIQEHDLVMRRNESAAVLIGCTWGA